MVRTRNVAALNIGNATISKKKLFVRHEQVVHFIQRWLKHSTRTCRTYMKYQTFKSLQHFKSIGFHIRKLFSKIDKNKTLLKPVLSYYSDKDNKK